MSSRTRTFLSLAVVICLATLAVAQKASPTTPGAVPQFINFSGVLKDANSKAIASTSGVTFLIYKDEQGGAPLWMETQNVNPDRTGHYTVQLGAANSHGLPSDIFQSGEARWLAAQVAGEAEQARVLLVSVPYALKAADAETIGGLPPSAFLRAASEGGSQGSGKGDSLQATTKGVKTNSPYGTANFIPLWTSVNFIQNSNLFQNASGNLGIGTTSPAAKLDVNGTGNFSGLVNSTGYQVGGSLFAFGSSTNFNAFAGFAGNTTMTGVGNNAFGIHALANNTTGGNNTALGPNTLSANTTGSSNTASGVGALFVNTVGGENTATGDRSLSSNTTGNDNTAFGAVTLFDNTAGSGNTATGTGALESSYGSFNTAIGYGSGQVVPFDHLTGSNNTAVGTSSAFSSAALTNATAIGANAEVSASNSLVLGSIKGVNSATADTMVGVGITAPVYKLHVGTINNGLRVEGPPTTGGVAISVGGFGDVGVDAPGIPNGRFVVKNNGQVGIGTASPDNTLSVNGSADKPGGGSWGTFSDRRLKNLNGNYASGLSQIMKIHPIRYRYKDENGMGIRDRDEHVGVVAQEIQQAIPEAVTENSKGYLLVNNDPILWAMVNAIKEQQKQIEQQRSQIQTELRQIRVQQRQIVRLSAQVGVLQTASRSASYAAASGQSVTRRAGQANETNRQGN